MTAPVVYVIIFEKVTFVGNARLVNNFCAYIKSAIVSENSVGLSRSSPAISLAEE